MFSDRFTGARNPARLPTTIQSRRIHCAPNPAAFGRYYIPSIASGFIIGIMRFLLIPALLVCAMAVQAADMTKLNITVKTQGGKPIDRASVVVRFIEGRSIVKLGKAIRTTFELRTNQDGEAKIPTIPQGKIRIQVIAKGFQTFGQIFEIDQEEKDVEIKLNPPQQQYTSHQ
jgi:hypothetical protein